METGNWIAIAVGLVSLAGIAVTWWLGKKRFQHEQVIASERFEHERELEDRRIAGEILDEAVLALREISSQVHGLLALLRNRPEAFHERPRGKTLFEELSEAGTILDRQADRLRFRFEGGPVAETFEETMDTTGKFFGILNQIRLEDFANADPAARDDVIQFCRGARDDLVGLGQDFDRHFDEFRKAAFEIVGIKTEERQSQSSGSSR
jgi:hypothetical protein